MKLPELQQICLDRFAAYSGDAAAPVLEHHIRAGRIPAAARIAVYENNYIQIVAGTLRNIYPTIEQLVGDVCFLSLARSYARTHPSNSGDLQSFGQAFPQLLDAIYSTTENAYLGDVARLEEAIDDCQTKQYLPAMNEAGFQQWLEAEHPCTALVPNPSFHLVRSAYPILSIWRAHRDDDFSGVSARPDPQRVAVVRSHDDAQLTLVGETGAALIDALARHADPVDALTELGELETQQLAQALRDTVASGAFIATGND